MNLPTPFILYPALRLLLVNRLQKSINFTEITSLQLQQSCAQRIVLSETIDIPLWVDLVLKPDDFFDIPLNQIYVETEIEYVSAIAFKLAQFQSLSTLALAEQIRANLNNQAESVLSDTIPEQIWRSFTLTVVEPGWIHLRLTNRGLAQWLQWAIDLPWQNGKPIDVVNGISTQRLSKQHSAAIFEILHAYARCSSLLRLGKQEKILQLAVDDEPVPKINGFSQSIPWLKADQSFRACQQQDWALIRQLCEALDFLATSAYSAQSGSSQASRQLVQSVKVAHRLSQAFQCFHAACRIWGMDEQSLPLAQVRLGLVLLTCKVLQALIERRLSLVAHSAL